MLVAVVLVVIAVGTVVFHVVSPWWWTPIASNWHIIDDATLVTFWITGVAYVAVILFMAYCAVRFRYRKGRRAAYEPENKRLEWWLTGLTSLGVIGLLTPGLIVWNEFVTVPDDAAEFEVVGRQWQWSYRLPGKDGVLGASDPRLITGDNTFGLDPNDPRGQDDVLIEGDDLHLPIGRPLKVLMRSADVIHDFYVPHFRAKMDIIPGMVTYFWFTPTRTGTFDILCAELCGVGHHTMRGMVVVEADTDYQEWLQGQSTFADLMARAAPGDAVKLAADEGRGDAAANGNTRSGSDRPSPINR
ncbi:MAG: cytochrome c oxidase subunit II [Rhodospirillales bacterium]|nr:cytochrome c oxidase subunit II [Rhodospirillales bacterium]